MKSLLDIVPAHIVASMTSTNTLADKTASIIGGLPSTNHDALVAFLAQREARKIAGKSPR